MSENRISKAFRIIAEELPQFFNQTNTPFLGKDEEESVMKEKSSGQREKDITEALMKLGVAAVPVLGSAGKAASLAAKNPVATSIAATAITKDPTFLIPGKIGMVGGGIGDAEATIVPAKWVNSEEKIKAALEVLSHGFKPKDVYKATGIYEGPLDKIPRSVVSDEGARLQNIRGATLGEFMKHDELYKVAPQLKDVKIAHIPEEHRATIGGGYDPKTNTMYINPEKTPSDILRTVLHEGQHVVQKEAGMVAGSNPVAERQADRFKGVIMETFKQEPNLTVKQRLNRIDELGNQIYKQGAGETEARATQYMYDEGRATGNWTSFPLEKYDTPLDRLLFPAIQN